MENQALIAALEQARSALDAIDAQVTQGRRDKLKMPQDPTAEPAEAPCEGCGKAGAECACEDDAAEME